VLAVAGAAILAGGAGAGKPKKEIQPAVQAKARAINVRRSDLLPVTNWKAVPGSSDASTPRCSFYNPDQSDLTQHGSASSPEFTLSDGSYATSSVGIFSSVKEGQTAYRRVVRPALPRCLAEIVRKSIPAPNRVDVVSSGRLAFPRHADRSAAFRVVVRVLPPDRPVVPFYLDLVTMNTGPVDTVLLFVGIGTPFETAFERKVAARMPAA